MNKKTKGNLSHAIQAIGVLPLLFFGIAVMILISGWITHIMYAEVELGLSNIANTTVTLLDISHPGDYRLEGDESYHLYKGDSELTGDYSLVDHIKEDTELDVTLFYQNTRILTTILNSDGERIIGTGAPEQVLNDVFLTGESKFYDKVIINGAPYFAYYMPLRNEDGNIVGMLFVGKPSQTVDNAIQGTLYPLAIMIVLTLTIVAICIYLYTKRLGAVLLKIRNFLVEVADGNMNSKLDSGILRRTDELGDIGRSALVMQRSLRTLVEQDALTELTNRRYAHRKLLQIAEQADKEGTAFCIAIGDIDFFKNVNDTYGHECGDLVLKNIASTLRKYMHVYGFASRWGGEEFLLVFDHMTLEKAKEHLEILMENIRDTETIYNGEIIHVTMTFGLTGADTNDITELLNIADTKLYQGKELGRNRIII